MENKREMCAVVNTYEKGDCCYATISSRSARGVYLELDNGQSAFAYNAGNLRSGVRILCTIVRPATMERRTLVRLDSVCNLYDYDVCA